MKHVWIRAYYKGKMVGDHIYMGDDQVKALDRYRRDFPDHNDCICVAETINDEDPTLAEFFAVHYRCGCAG